jgi:hypothetical protein
MRGPARRPAGELLQALPRSSATSLAGRIARDRLRGDRPPRSTSVGRADGRGAPRAGASGGARASVRGGTSAWPRRDARQARAVHPSRARGPGRRAASGLLSEPPLISLAVARSGPRIRSESPRQSMARIHWRGAGSEIVCVRTSCDTRETTREVVVTTCYICAVHRAPSDDPSAIGCCSTCGAQDGFAPAHE